MEKLSSATSPVKFEVLSLISLLISLFNEVISFLVDLILRFSFNFQSCLSIHRFIRLFARILSVFVLSSIIINPFRNDFWIVLILYFLSLLRFLIFMISRSQQPIQIVIYDWSSYLVGDRILRLLNPKCLLSALGASSMRKFDLWFVANACKVSKAFHLTVITNWRINFGAKN